MPMQFLSSSITKKPKSSLLLSVMLAFGALVIFSAPVFASTSSPSASQVCNGMSEISNVPCAQTSATSQNTTQNLIKTIIKLLSYVLGIIVVVMVIISGVLFATSAGEASKVKTAKSTLIYALIGLVIAALAQVIVHWVLGASSSISSGSNIVLFLHHY
jgi:hypothetical protein